MAKKFKNAPTMTKPVYGSIIGAVSINAQEVQEVQEVVSMQADPVGPPTQGRKGKKKSRINMAFSEENLAYIRVMAALQGQSMTQYVNSLIAADRMNTEQVYREAMALAKEKGKVRND